MGKQSSPRRRAVNEAQAVLRNLRISPQKLNLVAAMIRGMDANKAIATLSFSRRRIANDVKKVLQSAIANAENNHSLDVDRLFVKEAHVGKGLHRRKIDVDKSDLEILKSEITDMNTRLQAHDFVKTEELKHCNNCDYKNICGR